MKGALIVNHFASSPHFNSIYDLITESAARAGIELAPISAGALLGALDSAPNAPDFALFWDKDVLLARRLERGGWRLFNSAHTVEVCDNKALTAEALLAHGVPTPKKVTAPLAFPMTGYSKVDFIQKACATLGLPIVIKELYGSLGEQVYLAHTVEEAERIVRSLGARPFLFEEFIKESFGTDIRVNVVGGEVKAAMRRFGAEGEFRSNIGAGGVGTPVTLTEEQARVALAAARAVGADFAGVDLLIGKEGVPLVCEVNSNPHFTGTLAYCGINLADEIYAYIRRTLA
jgi:RimK family alpha-L-glutamate ligase